MGKLLLISLFASIVCVSSSFAAERTNRYGEYNSRDGKNHQGGSEVTSKEKYLDQINHGWAMYFDKDDSQEEMIKAMQKASPENKTVVMLLGEILKVNKENLETNKKILKILQKQFDPQPKKMVLKDGTECYENENAKCYKMPEFTPEAKLLVYRNFHQHPSIKTAAEVIKWEDRHIWEVRKSAHLRELALNRYADDIRPFNGTSRISYQDMLGSFSDKVFDKKVQKIYQLRNKYSVNLFFGKDVARNLNDIVAGYRLFRLFEKYGKPEMNFVFPLKKSAKVLKQIIKELNRSSFHTKHKVNYIVVSEETYSKLRIKRTPSLVLYNKKDKKFELVSSAPDNEKGWVDKTIGYFITTGEFKGSEISSYKVDRDANDLHIKRIEQKFQMSKPEEKKVEKLLKEDR